MKIKFTFFLIFFNFIAFSQKPFYVQPNWDVNQKINLEALKLSSIKNDTINQISNYKINLEITILEKDKNGYVAQIIYKNLVKNSNLNKIDAETLILNSLLDDKIIVKLSLFGKPLSIINLNELDINLENEIFKMNEYVDSKANSKIGFKAISQKKIVDNYISNILKVYCISTEREIVENKNYSFFKAQENSKANGVVSFKANYLLKKSSEYSDFHDLTFNINYDKVSLNALSQNLIFTNPSYNYVTAMKGKKYNLINLKTGEILKAVNFLEVNYKNFTEKINYEVNLIK